MYEQMSFEELADAPDALQGVSKGDAELLEKAFKSRTIRDMAENKYFNGRKESCFCRTPKGSKANAKSIDSTLSREQLPGAADGWFRITGNVPVDGNDWATFPI